MSNSAPIHTAYGHPHFMYDVRTSTHNTDPFYDDPFSLQDPGYGKMQLHGGVTAKIRVGCVKA
jgi:hypothetical protein